MPRKRNPIPSYLHHKPSNRAFVKVGTTFTYLGEYGSAESKDAYQKFLDGLKKAEDSPPPPAPVPNAVPTVAGLAAAFAARQLDGYSASETDHYWAAIGILDGVAGTVTPAEFGPLALTRVRDAMIAKGWTREHVNAQVRRVRAVFRWGESVELVPAGKWFQLRSLPGLKAGKTSAPGQKRKQPVADAAVDATIPHLSPTLAGMVRFQRLTGCRPQDVCRLNAAEIDRTGDVWVFTPARHKGAHRGQVRTVYIGPKAQAVIRHLVEADPAAPAVFSPRAAWAEGRRAGAEGGRKNYTPKGPPLNVGAVWSTDAYVKAVKKGCKRAGVTPWTPNQLRHSAGTAIRDAHGLETAQKILGHRHASTTERYASPTDRAAVEFALRNG